MTAPVLLILFRAGAPPPPFVPAIAAGRIRAVAQSALEPGDVATSQGLILGMHTDQVDLLARRDELAAFFARAGRMAFNGHLLRPFLHGLGTFVPIPSPKRRDYNLMRLNHHPIFDGIAAESLVTRRGVAGFYGRGHTPLPPAGVAITGIGPDRLPIDWEWATPFGGMIFMHAGNDLWTIADDPATTATLTERLVDWCSGVRGTEDGA